MTAIIVIGSLLAYVTSWALVARYWYGHIRPWTEPLACDSGSFHTDRHQDWCYRRYGMVDTRGEALTYATLFGLLGPLAIAAILLGAVARRVITNGRRELPEEVEAANRRLERELGIGDKP